jgi:hypothetical protein
MQAGHAVEFPNMPDVNGVEVIASCAEDILGDGSSNFRVAYCVKVTLLLLAIMFCLGV